MNEKLNLKNLKTKLIACSYRVLSKMIGFTVLMMLFCFTPNVTLSNTLTCSAIFKSHSKLETLKKYGFSEVLHSGQSRDIKIASILNSLIFFKAELVKAYSKYQNQPEIKKIISLSIEKIELLIINPEKKITLDELNRWAQITALVNDTKSLFNFLNYYTRLEKNLNPNLILKNLLFTSAGYNLIFYLYSSPDIPNDFQDRIFKLADSLIKFKNHPASQFYTTEVSNAVTQLGQNLMKQKQGLIEISIEEYSILNFFYFNLTTKHVYMNKMLNKDPIDPLKDLFHSLSDFTENYFIGSKQFYATSEYVDLIPMAAPVALHPLNQLLMISRGYFPFAVRTADSQYDGIHFPVSSWYHNVHEVNHYFDIKMNSVAESSKFYDEIKNKFIDNITDPRQKELAIFIVFFAFFESSQEFNFKGLQTFLSNKTPLKSNHEHNFWMRMNRENDLSSPVFKDKAITQNEVRLGFKLLKDWAKKQ